MLAQTLQQPVARSGLRPFHPWRDLGQVADLVALAFADELSPIGQEIIAEMRRWAAWGPLLWLFSLPDPFMTGFVWEENGRIVGNLSLSLANPSAGYWVISNVAVHPTYRRRGIARELLEAALELARAQGGRTVLLQVRADNEAACQLYLGYGFTCYHTRVEMQRAADTAYVRATDEPPPQWCKVRWRDRAVIRQLILAATPAAVRQYQYSPEADFRGITGWSLDDWLGDLLAGKRTYWQFVPMASHAAALLEAQRGPRYHRLAFLVHPEERGKLEKAAVQQGLWLLSGSPRRPILSSAPASALEAIEALVVWGFAEVRRLDQMKLELV